MTLLLLLYEGNEVGAGSPAATHWMRRRLRYHWAALYGATLRSNVLVHTNVEINNQDA